VHGGGPQLTRELKRLDLQVKFVNGLRVTGLEEMDVVETILSGKINKFIVGCLLGKGVPAVGLSGKDGRIIEARRVFRSFTGRPHRANVQPLQILLKGGYLPVVSPVSAGPSGEALNVNADDVATQLAVDLKASRLVLLTNVQGVLDKEGALVKDLPVKKIGPLIVSMVIKGGMIPKANAAMKAVRCGVGDVVIAHAASDFNRLAGTRIHG
jgi:acetylglutamate kinase